MLRDAKEELILFKVDFEKVYDHVEWNYLNSIKLNMTFSDKSCHWIMECIGPTMTSV